MQSGSVPRIDISYLGLADELGAGGQGRVTAVSGLRISDHPAALKHYSPEARASLDSDALEAMIAFARELPPPGPGWLAGNTAWPTMIAEDNGSTCGFLMRTVPAPYYFGFRTRTQGVQRKLADVAFLLNPDEYVSRAGLNVSDQDRLELLASIAATMSRLHSLGAVIGDVSPKNMLFTLRPAGCFIIDCDTIRLRERSVLEPVDTPDWEVPPGESRATVATDAYKFGLLAIRMFARDQSATSPAALAAVSPELGRLASGSQSASPEARPAPASWAGPLSAAITACAVAATAAATATSPAPIPVRIAVPVPQVSDRAAPGSSPGPAGHPAPPARRGLVIAAAVIVAGLVLSVVAIAAVHAGLRTLTPAAAQSGTADPGSAVAASSAGPVSGSGGSGAEQAAQLNDFLASNGATRREVQDAIDDVGSCTSMPAAAAQIQEAVTARQAQIGTASSLATSALPSGVTLKSELLAALRISLGADKDFLTWAQEMEQGCTAPAPQTAAYRAGFAASGAAGTAKLSFLRLWNPIASENGYPVRSWASM